ncbi:MULTISPECIES: YpmS family protein [Sporosarcina]|uniref:YpmS family protein n=1 Tax=Sporosarcina TaxID=1569 RepID=UPI00058B812A|nr:MULTISPECIES: YpmS family protein [Sporosarcina]WJY28234.1 YpmS family protein [Sporosarcina sp. 0.2-SM1T-5]
MNGWKIAFFTLSGVVAAGFAGVLFLIGSAGESQELPAAEVIGEGEANHLTVRTTKKDFEGIANTYIRDAMKGEKLPVQMKVKDDVILYSELTVFSFRLPVVMHFDPIVREDGNLILKQSSMELGQLNIQPSAVLKVLRDSIKLPSWMIVRPKEEEIFIDLSKVPVAKGVSVRAKSFNLEKDEIVLDVSILKR